MTRPEAREARFAAEVDELARDRHDNSRRELVVLCDESHPAYENQPAAAVTRMRGWVLLSLCRIGPLPDDALPLVLEELETAHDPYLLAVAAYCLRTYPQPLPGFLYALDAASRNADGLEAPLALGVFGGIGPMGQGNTSPKRELAATLAWMGSQVTPSHACCAELPEGIVNLFHWRTPNHSAERRTALSRLVLEDHSGRRKTYRQWFHRGPSIVAFFYTRCDNPQKCTLTLTKLSRVQKILEERGLFEVVGTFGITYDAAFDTPERLLRYGRNRGLKVDGDNHVLLRVPEGFDVLRRHFDLGVSFFESLVSRHRIELFVLDPVGRVVYTFRRLNWSEERAVDEAAALLSVKEPATPSLLATVAGLAASAVPKCPICWATYLSYLGLTGAATHVGPTTMKILAGVLLTIYLSAMFWRVSATGWHLAHLLSLAGALTITANLFVGGAIPGLVPIAAGLMLAASVLNVRRRFVAHSTSIQD